MPMPPASAVTPVRSTRTYPATGQNVRVIRADLLALIPGCPRADEVLVCASELATNAVLHSRSARPGGTITVHARVQPGDSIRIEVSDAGGPWTTEPADDDRPHGLAIVAAYATTWGTTETPTGRTVWAQLDWNAE